MSPQIAVFTNFMRKIISITTVPMEEQEEAMRHYFEDKANIFHIKKRVVFYHHTSSLSCQTVGWGGDWARSDFG